MTQNNHNNISDAHKSHPRKFKGSQFVYPVLSRRSGGISIGINLSPDKKCNFNCLYCQVKRSPEEKSITANPADVIETVEKELIETINMVYSGELFNFSPFDNIDPELRKLVDISFSGDGEPTAFPEFDIICAKAADIKSQYSRPEVKLVLITNSTLLHKPKVQEAISVLDNNNGEVWAKLDAGSEQYYNQVNRSSVSFDKIKENILRTSQKREIVIQSLFMNILNKIPDKDEIDQYIACLNDITKHGGHIKCVQIHTIARPPAESYVQSLTNKEIDNIASQVQSSCNLEVKKYYGLG